MTIRSKSSRTVVSPTGMEKFSKSPVSYLMDKWVLKSYHNDVIRGGTESIAGTVENVDGKHIHTALEDAFNFLKKGTQPGSDHVKKMLNEAFAMAEKTLETRGVAVSEHKSFLKSVIDIHGSDYLRKLSKVGVDGLKTSDGTISLMTEMPFAQTIGDKTPKSSILKGSADLVIIDTNKKLGTIIDYKNLFSYESAQMLESDLKAGRLWQPKAYALSLFNMYDEKELKEKELKNVEFYYELSKPTDKGRVRQQMPGGKWSRDQIPQLQSEILEQIAKMESMHHTVYNQLRAGDMPGLKDYIMKEVTKNCTPPASCKYCPLRYTCTYRPIANAVLMTEEGMKGNKSLQTRARKQKGYTELDAIRKHEALYDKEVNRKIQEFTDGKVKELGETRKYSGTEIIGRVHEEATHLRESYEALRRYNQGTFKNSAALSGMSARTKIPWSILDSRSQHAPWMSETLRKRMDVFSRERIKKVSSALNVRPELIEDQVMDMVYRDKEFAHKLAVQMSGKYEEVLDKHSLSHSNADVERIMRRPELIVNRHFAETLQGELDRKSISEIIRQDRGKIERHLGRLDPREFRLEGAVESVTTGLVDTKILDQNPDYFLKQLSRSNSIFGVREKFRLSKSKFPLTTALATFFLSYMAGTATVQSTVLRKIEKAQEYLIGSEEKVRDGQHSSAYTTARRLIMSDFGSMKRPSNPISMLIAGLSVRAGSLLSKLKEGLTVARGSLKAGEGLETSFGGMVKRLISDVNKSPVGPAVAFAGAAAATFAITGFLTNVKSSREIGNDVKDRKERFKRLKREHWNKDSKMMEPQSDLREAYKLHSDFGSGWAVARATTHLVKVLGLDEIVASMVKTIEGVPVLSSLLTHSKEAVKGSVSWLIDRYSKTKAMWQSRNTLDDWQKKIKDTAKQVTQSIDEMAQKVKEEGVSATAKRKAKEALERGKEINEKFRVGKVADGVSTTAMLKDHTSHVPKATKKPIDPPLELERTKSKTPVTIAETRDPYKNAKTKRSVVDHSGGRPPLSEETKYTIGTKKDALLKEGPVIKPAGERRGGALGVELNLANKGTGELFRDIEPSGKVLRQQYNMSSGKIIHTDMSGSSGARTTFRDPITGKSMDMSMNVEESFFIRRVSRTKKKISQVPKRTNILSNKFFNIHNLTGHRGKGYGRNKTKYGHDHTFINAFNYV